MAKRDIDWRMLDKLAMTAKQIESMPGGPAKENAKKKYQEAIAWTMDQYDLPAEVIPVDAHLLGVVDWAEGLMRTGLGETARLLKGTADAMRGKPSAYSLKSGWDNVVAAVVPVGQPARDTRYYLDELQVPIPDKRLSDIPGMSKDLNNPGPMDLLRVTPGGPADISLKGLAGFIGDAGITAKNVGLVENGYKRLDGGMNAVLDTGRLSEFGPGWKEAIPPTPKSYEVPMAQGQTAEQIRQAEEAQRAAARAAGAGGVSGGMSSFAKGLDRLMVDPSDYLSELAHKWRFRHADESSRLTGKTPVSQVMREHGGAGITSEGIRSDMRQLIDQHERAIDDIATGPVDKGMVPPVRRGTPADFEYLDNPDGLTFIDENGVRTQIPPSQVVDQESLLGPLWSAEQRELERSLMSGADAQGARKMVEDKARQAEAARQGFGSAESSWDDAEAAAGTRASAQHGGEQIPLWNEPPKVRTRTRPEQTSWTDDGYIRANRPEKTSTSFEGGSEATNARVNGDPLSIDRSAGWREVRDTRRDAQGEAQTRNWYNRRTDTLNPPTPGEAKKIAEEAALYARLAENASALETKMLDDVRPGLGGEVYKRHQGISSLLDGGQFLDRAPKAGPTTKTMHAFNPWAGRAFTVGQDAAHTAAMLAHQALKSPITRYMVAPSARSLWLENTWDRMNEPTDVNPYAQIYKRGVRP